MKKLISMALLLGVFFICSNEMQAQRTGVYINNVEINSTVLSNLQKVTGPINRGAYYLDQYGNFGVVGYYPSFNLFSLMQQYQANQYRQQNTSTRSNSQYYNQGNGRYTFREGNTTGYSNSRTGVSVTTDGTVEGSIFAIDGKVLNLPF